jgi:hypothetical protein
MLRPLLLSSSVLGISILTVFAGCSSSTTNNSLGDGGGSDTGVTKHDSGSSGGDGASGDDSSGGDAGTCSAGAPYTATTWTDVKGSQGACTATDISAFEKACGDNATAAGCNAWQTANVAGADGGGGTACGNCILPSNTLSTGGASYVTFDSAGGGYFGPNYPGCIQLLDPTNGSACAGDYYNLFSCLSLQCNLCTGTAGDMTSQDPAACQTADVAAGGICASYLSPYQTKCMADNADGGVANKCSPGNGVTQDPDWNLIIGLICGGGTPPTDSGTDSPTDSGAGG